jgi:1,4-alpha-glucan branching enzyme
MPGDEWQKFANLRLLLAYQFSHPGKKLLFMGDEFAEWNEWNHEVSLDWNLLDYPRHAGVQRLVKDLNELYSAKPALHELDCEQDGFQGIDLGDAENSTLSFVRKGKSLGSILAVFNLTPVPRQNYRVGVPNPGFWKEVLNSDAKEYGGSGQGSLVRGTAESVPWHGRKHSISITLPPLAAVLFEGA